MVKPRKRSKIVDSPFVFLRIKFVIRKLWKTNFNPTLLTENSFLHWKKISYVFVICNCAIFQNSADNFINFLQHSATYFSQKIILYSQIILLQINRQKLFTKRNLSQLLQLLVPFQLVRKTLKKFHSEWNRKILGRVHSFLWNWTPSSGDHHYNRLQRNCFTGKFAFSFFTK